MFHGAINIQHLWAPMSTNEWQSLVAPGDTLLARIIFVDHANKSVYLSVRPHIIEFRRIKNLPAPGRPDFLYIYILMIIILQ